MCRWLSTSQTNFICFTNNYIQACKVFSAYFSKYTVKGSFNFATEVVQQDSSNSVGGLDIYSLFANILLNKSMKFALKWILKKSLKKSEFKDLLSLATRVVFYIQDRVAMKSPLESWLANAFLTHNEQNWLDSCPLESRPSYYRMFVDDKFESSDHLKRFSVYSNSCYINISFTIETEQNKKISFLDVNVHKQGKFITTVYRKPTFSSVYTHFDSFIPDT